MFKNALAKGRVWHKRYTPVEHEFEYKLNSFLVDVDNPQQLSNSSKLISVNKFNIYYFNDANYLRGEIGELKYKVRKKLINLGARLNGTEKIFLLGQLSNLGIYFSPLNLYLCVMSDECRYVLAEVSNTPWNERHYYLIDMQNKPYVIKKDFHVSPFWGLNQDYHWTFKFSHDNLYFQIDNYQGDKKVFSAGYKAKLIPSDNTTELQQQIISSLWNSLKIITTIYYHAFKLLIKKVPFVPYPQSHKKKG